MCPASLVETRLGNSSQGVCYFLLPSVIYDMLGSSTTLPLPPPPLYCLLHQPYPSTPPRRRRRRARQCRYSQNTGSLSDAQERVRGLTVEKDKVVNDIQVLYRILAYIHIYYTCIWSSGSKLPHHLGPLGLHENEGSIYIPSSMGLLPKLQASPCASLSLPLSLFSTCFLSFSFPDFCLFL